MSIKDGSLKRCCARSFLKLKCPECDKSCGIYCYWFDDKKNNVVIAQNEIMRKLHERGFRLTRSSFGPLTKEIKKNIHIICSKERLEKSEPFSVENFYAFKK